MNSRRTRTLLSLVLGLWSLVSFASAAEFRGRLDPKVEMGTRQLSLVVAAPADLVAALPVAPGADDKVWAPNRPPSIKGRTFLLAIVAAPSGEKTLWLDRDADGKFAATERWTIPAGQKGVSLELPWDNGIYRVFPFRLEYNDTPTPRPARPGEPADPAPPPPAPTPTSVASIVFNFNVVFSGAVEVDGKPLRVMFGPKPADLTIDPTSQRTSVDANFNGRFEPELGEAENPAGKIAVFRVGNRYLAVKTADVATGELVLEERPASDYTRFAAEPGQVMPDFAFTDFDGGKHKLSDYRGKVVLLDFWGTWCGPCIEEMRLLDPLYEKYHARGFEIISMNMEKTAGRLTPEGYAAATATAKAFIAKAGHKWLQATQESIERVAIDVIHVNLYPTCILIGKDGKIISREARGEKLAALLEQHLQ
jgi:thiol-disulfide isomerase/thioredoxin